MINNMTVGLKKKKKSQEWPCFGIYIYLSVKYMRKSVLLTWWLLYVLF